MLAAEQISLSQRWEREFLTFLRSLLVADQLTLMSVNHPSDWPPAAEPKGEFHLEVPAGRSSTAPGGTFLLAWWEQARLLSRAECSTVVAVTPNHCPRVQKPPSKPFSHILLKFLSSAHGSALAGSRACVLRWSHFCFVKKLKWFCCSEWRAEVVSTSFGDILPNPSSIGHELNVNESEHHNRALRFRNRLFFLCLFFIATTNISSRKQHFPILPFLVSHILCVVSYPQIWDAKGKKGTQSLGLFSELRITQQCCSAHGLIKDITGNGISRREY